MILESDFGGRGSDEGVHDRARSAPPTMEGGVSKVELRSDPAYRSYYYQNGGGGARGGGESLFAMQPGFGSLEEEKVMQGGWDADRFTGYPGLGVGNKEKRIVNMEGVGYPTTVSRRPSLVAGQSNGESESSETHVVFHHESAPVSALRSGTNMQSISSSISQSNASSTGSSPRNLTPDLVRSPSHHISALSGDRMSSLDQRYVNIHDLYNEISPEVVPSADIITSLSGLSLSSGTLGDVRKYQKPQLQDRVDVNSQRDNVPFKQYPYSNGTLKETFMPTLNCLGSSASHYLNTASQNFSASNFGLGGYPASPLVMGNQVGDSRALSGGLPFESDLFVAAAEENYARLGNQSTLDAFPMAHTDPSYLDYLIANEYSSAALDNQRMHVESLANPPVDFLGNRNAYFEASLRRSQYGSGFGKSSTMNNGFHGNYAFGLGIPHRGNHIMSPMFPNCPIASGGSDKNVEQIMCIPSTLRNMTHKFGGPWLSGPGCNLEESFAASLLDEFKGNKTRCLDLAEIAGHVVEFSADQFGSRFIQQKLETASALEKNMIFLEIMPQALPLMTDVFGNYVIQKFLEHGSASQIRQLAEQLIGHVLTLSLQMYGCRVIQKALEVIELDQKKEMVAELDGHVLRCVRDQNGNHVIQKCIECVPENSIEFIVTTFYDQVVTLSTHPYGCRVIQRVLEHCDSPKTQAVVMEEIMNSVCMLAQDQYGNYVIQHVLGHGKPSKRSAIIHQLTGKIVEMSQQKFASNVIEKCLSCGTHEERQALVHEMLGSTDENEPLQVMMKDQFANYVVQKVLETCDDQQLELLLNRIKVHLNAVKKYTYGKHIVARVEKLVATGERRINALSSYAAQVE
ncbi:pumilio homolog 2-like isoform X1 [Salvia splendens]|uniref:pumilio homolog 2-like isoform X1 n=1 Tax=Salvia splendens TaxID=180675 RepID=UPI001C274C92|nr:pumilio homolog 2-like isoform X1 [Salvia splendens]